MSFEESTLTLGGETRKVESLDFVKTGTIGKTSNKGVTTVVNGEYTFLVSEDTLRYRFKPAGAKISKPIKHIASFGDLAKLPIAEVTAEDSKNKNTSATGTQEEFKMAQLNIEGKLIDIPAAVQKVLEKHGEKGAKIDINQFDAVMGKAKGADLTTLSQFEEKIQAEVAGDAGATTGADNKDAGAPQAGGNAAPAGGATADDNKGEGGATDSLGMVPPGEGAANVGGGAEGLAPSSIFTGNTGGGGGRQGTRTQKTEAEKEAERRERQSKREAEAQLMRENNGRIEELRSVAAGVSDATETITALKQMLLIDGKLPLFKTLVASDTRLRAEVVNLVKPADRVYHPKLQGHPEYKKTGKDIEAKYALGQYQVNFRESNPSQPTGYFIYVPECLMSLTPSKLSQHSEREMVLMAQQGGSRELTIKFFSKAEIIWLLAVLNADIVEYDIRTQKFNETAPHIYFTSKTDAQTGVPVYSLRAKDSEGRATKLSIRNFIPLATHDVIKTTSPDFDVQNTTDALFKRLLLNIPDGAPANKFSQLTPESAALFTEKPDGSIIYPQFKNTETVVAYDSTKSRPMQREVPLPKVVMSKPSTAGAVSRPVFSKSKHTEPGYNSAYKTAKDAVGDQINKQRKQTNKSILTGHTEEIARLTAINDLLSGSQIKIK